jgi:hypothetical protein
VRQIFAGADSRYLKGMSVNHTHLQADLPNMMQYVATATSPLARFAPTAATVSDQTVDEWVEQELRRGHCRMRRGLAILAFLAGVAIPVILLLK